MGEEVYKPTTDENINAHVQMSKKQEEMSAVRDIFMEEEPRLAELPSDLKYRLEQESYYTGRLSGAMSGKFDGRDLSLEKSSWDGKNWTFRGTADGVELQSDEVEKIYNDIYPLVIKFDEMRKKEDEASRRVKKEDDDNNAKFKEELKDAKSQGQEKGEKIGEISGILKTRMEKLITDGMDEKFLERIKETIIRISSEPRASVSVSVYHENDPGQPSTAIDDYKQCMDALFDLLGVNKESNPAIWEAGFGTTYVHSKVYKTIFPDIIVRVSYDRRELGGWNGSMLLIEKNTQFSR